MNRSKQLLKLVTIARTASNRNASRHRHGRSSTRGSCSSGTTRLVIILLSVLSFLLSIVIATVIVIGILNLALVIISSH